MELLWTPAPRPASLPPADRLREVLREASEAARDPSGGEEHLWRFYSVGPQTLGALARMSARRIQEEAGHEAARAAVDQWKSVPGWIVVTVERSDDDDHAAHIRERSLTAVQRFSLSLWSQGIRTNWTMDLLHEEPALYEVLRVDPGEEVVLGVLWYGHAERPIEEDRDVGHRLFERP